ncbi:tripartite tricarboxylate transporter permease [Desulfitibacter alkalitolerans]|uniref:tripartite tricarboxylate transporter permease n=1 Tax=Desulfitibacter alkalitolerans TaxID=264641 RepID=UPI0004853E83|nr:tripartite tricarboxylate transporter permease [Desulfitibacter alkalitolerans]
MSNFLAGLVNIMEPLNLFILASGVFLGLLSGATPGVSGLMAVVLLIPLTYGMEADTAFLLLSAVYAASVFSGSISAILFRTPGAPEAVATTLDGYELTKQGRASEALGISVFSSATGGLIGSLILMFVAPQLAKFALKFGPVEYFALAMVGLSVITVLGANNLLKALLAGLFGLFLATIGIDAMTGVPRFTFGVGGLMSGIDFIPVLIGLFAISEVLRRFMEDFTVKQQVGKITSTLPGLSTIKRLWMTIGRSSLLGTIIGILPGIGATTASMVSYSEAVRWAKDKDKFGKGAEEGIAAPESANNAAANGAMVPLLALGIPGSATTAVLLGAFILHGIRPGPLLFTEQPVLVMTLFIGLFLSNFLILAMAKPFIKMFANIIRIPYSILGTLILMLCIIGSYALRNNMLDVWLTLIFGLVGYVMEKYKYPLAPVILGLVLGGMAEQELRRALIISKGSWSIFLESNIAVGLLIFGAVMMFWPLILKVVNLVKKKSAAA